MKIFEIVYSKDHAMSYKADDKTTITVNEETGFVLVAVDHPEYGKLTTEFDPSKALFCTYGE